LTEFLLKVHRKFVSISDIEAAARRNISNKRRRFVEFVVERSGEGERAEGFEDARKHGEGSRNILTKGFF